MDSSSKRSATYDIFRAEVFRLRGKLKSVQDYSEQNFNHHSKRLKVYFEEIQKIASDTAAIQSVVGGDGKYSRPFTAGYVEIKGVPKYAMLPIPYVSGYSAPVLEAKSRARCRAERL